MCWVAGIRTGQLESRNACIIKTPVVRLPSQAFKRVGGTSSVGRVGISPTK